MTKPAGAARASAEPITAVIAERVRDLRERSGLTQGELADRMAELGVPWKRATVINLETRAPSSRGSGAGRDAVTVQELLALAVIFDVPPIWLLADPREGTPTPITAKLDRDPWNSLLWLGGRQALTDTPGSPWDGASRLLDEVFKVANLIARYRRWSTSTDDMVDSIDVGSGESRDQVRRHFISQLGNALRQLADWGYTLPPVPADVRVVAREFGIDLPGGEG